MRKLEIYNPEKTYLFPSMQVATPEKVQTEYSATNITKCVIETDVHGEMFYSIESLNSLKNRHNIDSELSDTDALLEIEAILNAPQPEPEPTAEERIASAMEFQNIITM